MPKVDPVTGQTPGQALAAQTGETILQKFEEFGTDLILGTPDKIKYHIPAGGISKTFSFGGRTILFEAAYKDGDLILSETPQ